MVQIAAPSVASAAPSAPGQSVAHADRAPQSAGFAQVLADQADRSAPAPAKSKSAAAAAPVAATGDGVVAQPAAADSAQSEHLPELAGKLPGGGKPLPVLPEGPEVLPAPVAEAPAAEPATPPAGVIPSLLAAVHAIRVANKGAAGEPTGAPKQTDSGKDADDDAADPTTQSGSSMPAIALPGTDLTVAAVLPASSPAAGPAQSGPANAALPTGAATSGSGLPQAAAAVAQPGGAATPALPAAIAAQMAGLPLPPATGEAQPQASAAQPRAADPALALKVDPAAPQPAALPGLSIEPAAAKPMAGVRLRPVIAAAEANPTLVQLATNDLINPLTNSATTSAAVTPAAAALPSTAPLARPHDFAGLVDRLIAARDAAQSGAPQSVQMSLNHAEFGRISLNFQHDQSGLAVSVASSDPDFARAVQAAVPAASAATGDAGARDTRQGSGHQPAPQQIFARADGSAAGQSGQRQPGNGAVFGSAATRPTANPSTPQDEAAARSRGIFA